MGKVTVIAATRLTAAKMLDLKPSDFDTLVEVGALPRPVALGKHQRWPVAELEAIVTGKRFRPQSDFEL
jgi:predicted DNA-binding transcriptional regulator AlpA